MDLLVDQTKAGDSNFLIIALSKVLIRVLWIRIAELIYVPLSSSYECRGP